ncbi:MAG: transcriptional repressor, partial [Muribaculaceae bacterium]|nr:transcriptional repressor [Muribaculaceae bacterium]
FVDCSLVRRLKFGIESEQYEKVDGTTNHLHLVCTHCGKIKEAKDAELTRALGSKKFRGFQTGYFTLYFHGVCSKCKKQMKEDRNIRNKQ